MICPECGMKIPEDSVFCQHCGSNVLSNAEQVPAEEEYLEPDQNDLSQLPPATAAAEIPLLDNEGEYVNILEDESIKETDPGIKITEEVCPECGMRIPEDSVFCQYCGNKITLSVDYTTPNVKDNETKQDNTFHGLSVSVKGKFAKTYDNLDCEIPAENASKKKASKKWVTAVICLSGLIVVLAGLNVYQYISSRSKAMKITELSEKVDKLNSSLSEKETLIKGKDAQIVKLKEYESDYKRIVNAVKKGDLGYAASNFHASESIIVVGANEKNRKFTLTANWTNGGSVSIDYYLSSAAYIDFDQDSWLTSTQMTIYPLHPGITGVTFSNSVNSQVFDVIIIVE